MVVVGWTVNDAEDGIDEGIVSTVTAFFGGFGLRVWSWLCSVWKVKENLGGLCLRVKGLTCRTELHLLVVA